MNICSPIGQHRRRQARMYFIGVSVIWTLSTIVAGTDYLISVHRPSLVDVTTDGDGGSVRVTYPNDNVHEGYGVSYRRTGIRLDKTISTILGFDNSTVLISCSHSAMKLLVYSDKYKYNVFFPLPANALGTRYVVSSCIQNDMEHSVLVITAYKLNADVTIRFDTNVEFSYDGQMYRKGDTFRLSLRAYQTFNLRVRHDLSGTRINSTEPIAVFSGTANSTTVYTYIQLLPVELFSDEFVIAVDDSLPSFQLQVIGEYNGFGITFKNETFASTESGILKRILKKNETFHFVSNKPVMATLCRSFGYQKGFALVPPVSSYRHDKSVSLFNTSLLVTLNTAVIDIPSFVKGAWEYISHSRFKIGRFWRKNSAFTATSKIMFSYIAITFRSQTFYIDGLSLEKEDQPITDPTSTFIVVAPDANPLIVTVGEDEAFYQVRCSGGPVKPRNTYPFVGDYFDIPSDTVCIVETNDEHLHVFLQDTNVNKALSVPIFPVTSLGKNYVIPSYDMSIVSTRHIRIATGNWTTSVDVTKKDGFVTRYDLREYQTVTVNDEPSGMLVSSSRDIAVFNEHNYGDFFGRHTYTPQLVPSKDFGNEYVLAVGSLKKDFFFADNVTEEYYLKITCLNENTTIIFNDGLSVTIGEDNFYHKDIMVNGSLHFKSSNPVMTYLCLKAEVLDNEDRYNESTCSILPPVEQYANSAVFIIPQRADFKIMTKIDNTDFHAFTVNHRLQKTTLIVKWENVPFTDFKVGTATAGTGNVFMESTHTFSTITYGYDCCSIPVFNVLFSISTSSLGVHQLTPRPSTNAGLTSEHTSTSTSVELQRTTDLSSGVTSTNTPEYHQQTTNGKFPTTVTMTTEVTSFATTLAEEQNIDENIVKDEDSGVTILVVGCVCGFIILVLGCIVGYFVIRMRRSNKSKSKSDTHTSRTNATEQETSFEGPYSTIEEGEGHTYSDLTSKPQAVNEYESLDGIHCNQDIPQHANTYSDLNFVGKVESEYDKIENNRKKQNL